MIVVDTNVIASLWVPNDMEDVAYNVLRKDPEWIAPLLWRSELRSVMTLYLRKDLLDLTTVSQAMQEAEQLLEAQSYEVNSLDVFRLVQESTCSSYDCEFVALANDLGIPLITFDQQICNEFSSIAVHPQQFIA
jgi:predicted nucleic acid-binding protein